MIRSKTDDKTNHQYYEERLSAYLDGELTPQELDAVNHHVVACQACQWELRTLAQTVQWTKELPAVSVPRVFTIPVPARRERVPRRQWRFVPVLQGATVLVALLLFFVVGGDFLLGGYRTAYAPQFETLQDRAPVSVEATQVVEAPQEAPAAAESETVIETVVVEEMVEAQKEAIVTLEVEKAVEEATEPAMLMAVPETEAPVAAEAAPAPTLAPEATAVPPPAGEGEVGGLGAGFEEAATSTAAPEAVVPPPSAPRIAATEAYSAPLAMEPTPSAPPEPSPAALPTPSVPPPPAPTASPAPELAQPTTVASADELAQAVPAEQESQRGRLLREPAIYWLRLVEVVLAATFILLAATTLIGMVQRRRAR